MMTKKIKLLLEGISILFLIVFLAVSFSGCAATRHTVQNTAVTLADKSVDDLVDKLMRQKMPLLSRTGFRALCW
jgi:hypothetical protein